ncbi:MAG: HigA family addiction module antidote protein [Bacteroidales bacterium]|nr:HigA family addiction module antidote protein [Candidatus Physcocola equi]
MERKNDLQELIPFKATHPGAIIAEELDYLGIKHNEFAQLIGMQPTHFSSLLKGRRSLSTEVALKIEEHTELKAEQLMALQSKYEIDCKRIEQRMIDNSKAETKLIEFSAVINLSALVKEKQIPADSAQNTLETFETKFSSAYNCISSIDNRLYGCFKKSEKAQTDERNLRTWLLLAMYNISNVSCDNKYEDDCAESAANEIAAKANQGRISVEDIAGILDKYGILYCHVKKLDKVPVDAFSTMSVSGHPAIVATYRYNDIDKLVFDILHELGHISLHFSTGNSFIKIGDETSSEDIEVEADSFARDHLISPTVWRNILRKGSESIDSLVFYSVVNIIAKVAQDYGINPTIAVARYKKESGQYNVSKYKSPKIF